MNQEEQRIVDMLAAGLAKRFEASTSGERNYRFFESHVILAWLNEQMANLSPILLDDKDCTDANLAELKRITIASAQARVQRGTGHDSTLGGEAASWLDLERQTKIGWNLDGYGTYRERYFEYLRKYSNRDQEQLAKTKASTLRVIQNIGDPLGAESFNSRGLVVGPVQGGKTEHFNGVVATAFDAGYHLVIVMSGIMEDLRAQTQARIRNDLLGGYDQGKATGANLVAEFKPSPGYGEYDVHPLHVLTSSKNDFNASRADLEETLSSSKTLIVCKKNQSILKQVLLYLQMQMGDVNDSSSILIIDDEADNASLNNNKHKGKTLASLINKRVRAILGVFSKSAYVGYTASPFANIIQDRERGDLIERDAFSHKGEDFAFDVCEGLFPRDFIELIRPPAAYVGLKQMFDTSAELPKVLPAFGRQITDDLEAFPKRVTSDGCRPTAEVLRGITRAAKKDDPFPEELPVSLKDAVYCFIIATAIRKTRSKSLRETPYYQPHNTMLIHVSRFIQWQNRTRDLLALFVGEVAQRLINESVTRENGIYETLERQFDISFVSSLKIGIDDYLSEDYIDTYLTEVSFSDIRSLLPTVVDEIQCLALNSQTGDNLEYKKDSPKTYLAIGGNRLARGFTLEGLTTCYFIRDTNFADTLLQMGRWFGYRMGYLDCCKLFMTADAVEKFDSISRTVEELESSIEDLSRDPESTPDSYALRMVSNPSVIKLTRNSMLKGTKKTTVSYEDRLEQTYCFSLAPDAVESAYSSLSKNITSMASRFNKIRGMLVYRDADLSFIKSLLEAERSFTGANVAEILTYIQECNKNGLLTNWTVALNITGGGKEVPLEDFGCTGESYKITTSL
ncbi:Z1 domain-containing protein, partial [Acidimicrobiia bacterium]|nr:Z1 domain-containing protein [Acidimicrobiia bacterium]